MWKLSQIKDFMFMFNLANLFVKFAKVFEDYVS